MPTKIVSGNTRVPTLIIPSESKNPYSFPGFLGTVSRYFGSVAKLVIKVCVCVV